MREREREQKKGDSEKNPYEKILQRICSGFFALILWPCRNLRLGNFFLQIINCLQIFYITYISNILIIKFLSHESYILKILPILWKARKFSGAPRDGEERGFKRIILPINSLGKYMQNAENIVFYNCWPLCKILSTLLQTMQLLQIIPGNVHGSLFPP